MQQWWVHDSNEIYWLEITDRQDIGVDLKAPQWMDNGREHWSYSLLKYTADGDIVFHYSTQQKAIIAWSRIAAGCWGDDIVWAAHGTTARGVSLAPYQRPGWKVGLSDHERLQSPVTFADVESLKVQVLAIESELASRYGSSLYLGFNRYRDTVRTSQGYLTKLPSAFVALFPVLHDAAKRAAATQSTLIPENVTLPGAGVEDVGNSVELLSDNVSAAVRYQAAIGASYRPADEVVNISTRDPMVPDPALVERGNRGHAKAQNALADRLDALGFRPRSPRPDEPNYDLAWMTGTTLWVAEVKSLTEANEERQLRLALGQVLRYSDLMKRQGYASRPVVMAERMPADDTWPSLCERLGVLLLWPDRLTELSELIESDSGHSRPLA